MSKKKGIKYESITLSVPVGKGDYYREKFYRLIYEDDPTNGMIIKAILDNPGKSATEICRILKKDSKLRRMTSRVANVAKRIGIPIQK